MSESEINQTIAKALGWRIETREFKMTDGIHVGRKWSHLTLLELSQPKFAELFLRVKGLWK
jgi:hypothetical protein